MNVIKAIAALLYDHDTVIVPALGAFVRTDESAQVNVITGEFHRPTSRLGFDPSQREEHPLLMDYLMLHAELSDEDARQEIAAFVTMCYTKLREGETVALDGIGTLSFNSIQETVFEPDPSADFNADAFGLNDMEVPPVYQTTAPAPEAPKPSNAEPAVPKLSQPDPEEERPRHRTWWLWLLLLLLVGGLGLWYFKYRPVQPDPVPPTPIGPLTITDTLAPVVTPTPVDTVAEVVEDTMTLPVDTLTVQADVIEVVKPLPSSKAFIVGGCFSIEENALNMTREALDQGCKDAFVMKRGTKFYVCYGQYPSTTDAKTALPEILEKYNRKAWILF